MDKVTRDHGEAILQQAVDQARTAFGDRLVAAYALGSLAHGGFSPLVSDVDLGLILADPLQEDDATRVATLNDAVKATGLPLADRLSTFWGTPATLRGDQAGGRFPPLDRLDLLQEGRLLAGQEARTGLPKPSHRDLILGSVEFALGSLATPEVVADLANPAGLVAAGARRLTKRILFPIRFLYTAQVGAIGRNDAAVQYFRIEATGPTADLAAAGLRWREDPPAPGDEQAIALVRAGLIPIYLRFIDDHIPRMREFDRADLVDRLLEWRFALVSAG